MQTGTEFPGKVMPPVPNYLWLQAHDVYPNQSLHAATSMFLLVLDDDIPLRNSELPFIFLRNLSLD